LSDRALITGATGLIGSHLAAKLKAKGFQLRALVRETSRTGFLESLDAELATGDLADAESLRQACDRVDVVFHAAAKLGEWGPREEFERLNVKAVSDLVKAAADAGVSRFVHVSSVAVYGRLARQRITEDAEKARTGHPYMDTKADGEEAALRVGKKLGLEVAVVRPSLVYGENDRNFLPHLCRQLRQGRCFIVGSGDHRANSVYAGSVADLCLLLATHTKAPFEAFNVCDPDPLSWREFLTMVALRMDLEPPHLRLPTGLVYAGGAIMETTARLFGTRKPPPMTRFIAKVLGTDLTYSTEKASRLLGFAPSLSVREGIGRSLDKQGVIRWMRS